MTTSQASISETESAPETSWTRSQSIAVLLAAGARVPLALRARSPLRGWPMTASDTESSACMRTSRRTASVARGRGCATWAPCTRPSAGRSSSGHSNAGARRRFSSNHSGRQRSEPHVCITSGSPPAWSRCHWRWCSVLKHEGREAVAVAPGQRAACQHPGAAPRWGRVELDVQAVRQADGGDAQQPRGGHELRARLVLVALAGDSEPTERAQHGQHPARASAAGRTRPAGP